MFQVLRFMSSCRKPGCDDKCWDRIHRTVLWYDTLGRIQAENGKTLVGVRKYIVFYYLPLRPTYFRQTKPRIAAFGEKSLERLLALAEDKTKIKNKINNFTFFSNTVWPVSASVTRNLASTLRLISRSSLFPKSWKWSNCQVLCQTNIFFMLKLDNPLGQN